MKWNDEQVDQAIGDFLQEQLGGQSGRALRAFAERAEPAHRPVSPMSIRSTGKKLFWGVAAALVAAAVTAALALPGRTVAPRPVGFVPRPTPMPAGISAPAATVAQLPRPLPPPGANVTDVVSIRDVDNGVVLLNGRVPMRELQRQTLREISWFDPRYQAKVRIVEPRQQILLLPIDPD